ncbi:hypothetical protein GALL_26140 [mine drainage metagenome]|uniref:Uncharacterized protein n=1 Tax=mine drainage metagenome TaxID=410659 RepID=A0A1J5T7E8_9ZZZZ
MQQKATPLIPVDQQDLRFERVHRAFRAVSGLAYSEQAPDEALLGKRRDLSDLLEILCDELEYTITGTRPLL